MRQHVLRRWTRFLAMVIIFAICAFGIASVRPAQAADGEQPNALAEFGACLHGQGKGALILLVDQSGSLRQTDPTNDRITAGKYLIERFANFADNSMVKLDIKVSGFAAKYDGNNTWSSISLGNMGQVQAALDTVGTTIHDYDTDYWTALNNARADIEQHAQEMATTCKAIAWLTDGEFDIDVRDDDASRARYDAEKSYAPSIPLDSKDNTKKVIEAGKEDICRPKGVADQLRASNISMMAIGLTQADPDYSFVKSVLAGGGANAATYGVSMCGEIAATPGLFLEAKDLDSLYLAFDAFSTPGQTTQQREAQVCQGQICNEDPLNFVLDDTLSHVQVLVSSEKEGIDAYLLPPNNKDLMPMLAGQKGEDSSDLPFRWLTPRTLEFNLDSAKISDWTGEWRLVLVDRDSTSAGKKFHANLHLHSFVQLDVSSITGANFHKGETYEGLEVFAFDSKSGEKIDLQDLKGRARIDIVLKDAQGTEHRIVEGSSESIKDLLTLDTSEIAIGKAQIRASIQLTTASIKQGDGKEIPGTLLAPNATVVDVVVNPPLSFPSVVADVDFGLLDGTNSATADLQMKGEGCVWINDSEANLRAAPASIARVRVTSKASSKDSCTKLEGSEATVPVSIAFDHPDNGALLGDFNVSIMSADGSQTEELSVPFKAEVQKPLNVATAWGTFIVALIAGVGLPILMLYVFKYFGAVIPKGQIGAVVFPFDVPEGDAMMPLTIPVPVEGHLLQAVPKGARHFSIGGYTFKVRMGASPVSRGWVELQSSAPSISGDYPGHMNGHATMPLGLRGQWIAVQDQPNSPKRITLILLASNANQDALEAVARVADQNLRTRLKALAEVSAPPAAESDDELAVSTGILVPPAVSDGQGLTPPAASPATSVTAPPIDPPFSETVVTPAPPTPGYPTLTQVQADSLFTPSPAQDASVAPPAVGAVQPFRAAPGPSQGIPSQPPSLQPPA